LVSQQQFREDLLYRINTIHVKLPPLRERKEDIIPLVQRFLQKYADFYGKPSFTIRPDAQAKLKAQPWMGNIRELDHTVEKTVIMSESRLLTADDFDCSSSKQEMPLDGTATLEDMEYNLIKTTIAKCDGNLSMVASRLGISRQTLYNKIKRYGL
jgi:DNA-binding NtrC family response regulator